MKKYLFSVMAGLFLIAGNTSAVFAQKTVPNNKQINFLENAWTEAVNQAKAQNKYIFVDAYTTWCGPCKILKSTTFKNEKAAAFFNANFINVAIDLEKGVGPQLASQWHIRSIPTLIIFDPKGNAVAGSEGLISAKQLLDFGQKALAKK